LCWSQSLIIAIKHHIACNEACASATTIATNASVIDFSVVIERRQGCATWQPRLFIAEGLRKHCVCTTPSKMCRLCQQSPPLLAGAQAPQDKCLISEQVELSTTINLIDDWAMGNSDLCALKAPDAQIVWRLSGARFAPLHVLRKP
jgi:hypothetical protein